MTKTIVAISLGAAVLLSGSAQAGRAHKYEATIRCRAELQEDSAANVKLVKFERTDDGLKLVYRCKSKGY